MQNTNYLIGRLSNLIDCVAYAFKIWVGKHLRNYLIVGEVGSRLGLLLSFPNCNGFENICSSKPNRCVDC